MKKSNYDRMRDQMESEFLNYNQEQMALRYGLRKDFMDSSGELFFNLVRKRLYRRLHALAVPLTKLTDVFGPSSDVPFPDPPSPDIPSDSACPLCATDGRRIFWNRPALDPIDSKEAADRAEMLLLHQVIHCLFGHPFSMPAACRKEVWSLACDLAAWHILGIWAPELLPEGIRRFFKTFPEAYLGASPPELPLYQARALARRLEEEGTASQNRIRDALFSEYALSDGHGLWPVFLPGKSPSARKTAGEGGGQEGNGAQRKPHPASHKETDAETKALWNRLGKQLTGKGAPLSPAKEPKGRPGMRGEGAGGARYSLRLSDTRRHDYRQLLKSLARWGEEMKLNDSEFQYAPYLYGLEHYNGMPLLEPLEYEETARIRELAIVIDTSASCSRSMTQAFLEETRNLLSEEALFFHPFNLHVIQCDREVRRDDRLTSPEDLKDYIDTLEICGMGGTDFRPAFARIRQLRDCLEFSDLSAILFFTDGSGIYPSDPPDVRTVFLFLKDHYDAIDVPDWAEILILDADTKQQPADH